MGYSTTLFNELDKYSSLTIKEDTKKPVNHIDFILGSGRHNNLIEITGLENSCKSYFALASLANIQSGGGRCVYSYTAHLPPKKWFEKLQITNDLILLNNYCAEDLFSILATLIKSDKIDFIVLDSIAETITHAQNTAKFNGALPWALNILLTSEIPKIKALLIEHNVTLLIVNQLRGTKTKLYSCGGSVFRSHTNRSIKSEFVDVLTQASNSVGMRVKLSTNNRHIFTDIYF